MLLRLRQAVPRRRDRLKLIGKLADVLGLQAAELLTLRDRSIPKSTCRFFKKRGARTGVDALGRATNAPTTTIPDARDALCEQQAPGV